MSAELHGTLVLVLVALLGLGALARRRSQARLEKLLAAPPPPDPTAAARFRKRRLGCFVVCATVGPAALALLFTRKEPLVVAGMVTLGALFAVPLFAMRCPVCGEMPDTDGEGIDLDPGQCPSCGTPLK